MFVTAPVWKDRLLRTNSAPSYRNNSVLLVTGNNVEVNTDFERRVCLIRLDAKAFRPYERAAKEFTHPDLLRWVAEYRPSLLGAMFTIARAWFAAGSPSPKKLKPLGGFEEHMRIIGGILEFAGIDGFMGNADTVRERSAEENAPGALRLITPTMAVVSEEVLSLDEALTRLVELNPRQARVVELRYFGGLSVEQIASILGIAPRSVKRDWALARIWLFNQLRVNAE